MQIDINNCGACNNVCPVGQSCIDGACVTQLYFPAGVQENVADSQMTGWTQCLYEAYGVERTGADIKAMCPGSKLLVGCKHKNAPNWHIVAAGERSDVFFFTGTNVNSVHTANGVSWYYSEFHAFGFAPEGETVQKTTCDVSFASAADKRLCWHTLSFEGGYRCGTTIDLDGDSILRGMWTAD